MPRHVSSVGLCFLGFVLSSYISTEVAAWSGSQQKALPDDFSHDLRHLQGSNHRSKEEKLSQAEQSQERNLLQLRKLASADRARTQHAGHGGGAKNGKNPELVQKIRPEQLAKIDGVRPNGEEGDHDDKPQSEHGSLFTKDRPGRRERASQQKVDSADGKDAGSLSQVAKPVKLLEQTTSAESKRVTGLSSAVRPKGEDKFGSFSESTQLGSKLAAKISADKRVVEHSQQDSLQGTRRITLEAEEQARGSETQNASAFPSRTNLLPSRSGVQQPRKRIQSRRKLLAAEEAVGAVGEGLASGETQEAIKEGVKEGLKTVQNGVQSSVDTVKDVLPDNMVRKMGEVTGEAKALLDDLQSPDLKEDDRSAKISWVPVLWMTVLMGSAAGLGSFPFFFVGSLSKEWSALANALACGVMLACSFDLVHEGQPYGGGSVILGIVLGALFISASQKYLEDFEDVKFQGLQGINARKILLMIGIMSAHAFGEGAGVGVSFCGSRGWAQGVLVTLAIGLHNVPEGLAVSTVLVARGIRPSKALMWTLFTAMPQPLVAVPAFLFVDTFRSLLPVALGFAAGCMVWMVFAELLPDALADASHGKVATTATFAAAWLEGLRMLLATFEGDNGDFSLPSGISRDLLSSSALLLGLSCITGVVGSQIGHFLVKNHATGVAFAGGILTWQGLLILKTGQRESSKLSLATLLAWLICGVFGAYLLRSFVLPLFLGPERSKKVKEGGTPKRDLNGLDTAADLVDCNPGLPILNGNGIYTTTDLESGYGPPRKVFEPYKEANVPQSKVLVASLGLLTMTVISIYNGYKMAENISSGSAQRLWLSLSLWTLLPGMLCSGCSTSIKILQRQRWAGPCFASIAPFAWIVASMHRAISPGTEWVKISGPWTLLLAGLAIGSGLGIMLPHARRENWKRTIAGLTKGVSSSVVVQLVIVFVCRKIGPCVMT